ncbi:hypothetical protein HDU98_009523 [Podochytrium sp. JEL0797]|nr:hypothetical protein HDU98_009523 [Podochytrium sp. JEL0797]
MDGTSTLSLSGQFEQAQRIFNEIEQSELGCSCIEYQTKLHSCIAMLASCASMTRQLGVFSANEQIEDLNTLDIRFLLIDFYLGMLSLKRTALSLADVPGLPADAVVSTDRFKATKNTERLEILKETLAHFDSFLFSLDLHEALSDQDKQYILDPSSAFRMPKDPALLRAGKIERFKRERALKDRLKVLQAAVEEARKDSGGAGGEKGNKIGGAGHDDEPELRDDDLYRELLLATLELCVQQSIDEMRVARDEMSMLEQIAAMEAARAPQPPASETRGDGYSDRLDDLRKFRVNPDTLLTKEGKPRQPFMIVNQSKREEFQKGVFRSSNLPTMSVDEFLANEFARGNVISGGGKTPEKIIKEDLGDEADELETMKARAWDDYKDANPKGWGNRMNKG